MIQLREIEDFKEKIMTIMTKCNIKTGKIATAVPGLSANCFSMFRKDAFYLKIRNTLAIIRTAKECGFTDFELSLQYLYTINCENFTFSNKYLDTYNRIKDFMIEYKMTRLDFMKNFKINKQQFHLLSKGIGLMSDELAEKLLNYRRGNKNE